MAKALISGVTGQDGSYLAELLLDEGFEVHGIVRRLSVAEHQSSRIESISDRITTHYGDLTDPFSLLDVVSETKPDFVFNLAAMSHVGISFRKATYTANVNALGAFNMLDVCRRVVPQCRYYQASSSEMFGTSVSEDGYQRESTPMTPTSPYGLAKLNTFKTVQHYRRAYRMHATNGILFNHSSPRRGSNFVEAKIVKRAVEIYKGREKKLTLGNLYPQRDIGHSYDYVRAMLLLLRQAEPRDCIVATGETHSIQDIVQYVFSKLGFEDWRPYVVQDAKFMRAEELPYLRGDASQIRSLGWEPTYSFESMMDEIIAFWKGKIQ